MLGKWGKVGPPTMIGIASQRPLLTLVASDMPLLLVGIAE